MDNDVLYDKALEAIEELFSDKSVSQDQAKDNLETLMDDMQMMIESLDLDEM